MEDTKIPIISKSYSISKDIADWVEQESKDRKFRSASHFVETVLRTNKELVYRAKKEKA